MTVVAVGTDLVDVDRIRTAMERTPALEARVFTPDEIAYCRSAHQPWERFAARWAAKEAVVKCLGGGVPGLELTEIEVVRGDDGAPRIVLRGEAAARASARGITDLLVSMTHVPTTAHAVVVAR